MLSGCQGFDIDVAFIIHIFVLFFVFIVFIFLLLLGYFFTFYMNITTYICIPSDRNFFV